MALYKHRIEKRLREMNRWLDATLRSITDAVVATDGRQYVRLLNPAAERLLGCPPPLAHGKDLSALCRLTCGANTTILETTAKQAIRDGQAVDLPTGTTLAGRNERTIPVEGSVAPIHDDEGNFTGLVVVLRDITARQQVEQLQRQNAEHLRHAEKMEAIGRLAGGVAHEFNNLLTAILGNTSLVLATMPRGDANAHQIVQIETAALRAAEVVRQLFAFSGRAGVTLEMVNLNDSIRQTAEVLRRSLDARIQLSLNLATDLWPIRGDRSQLGELLRNLCHNALDAMVENGGTLTLATANVTLDKERQHGPWRAPAGEYVQLSVSDTGRGMTQEVQERIFEPFFTTKEPGQGTGLGLALVFGIVEEHHGWIECASEPEHGTRLAIYLPRYGQNVEMPARPAAGVPTQRGVATILLADDEPMIRDLATNILQRYGYQVLLAEDGLQAVEIYQREKDHIDLVILDLAMPRLTGDDAFRRLIAIDPNVRVLLSSGYFPEDLSIAEGQVLGFINKPYRHEELLSTIRAALQHPRASAPEKPFVE
jgi:PAS domain S-box-containing protein